MPVKNGIEICREIRENNVTTPIIMLTAKDSTDDKIKGLHAGADDYLVKPFHSANYWPEFKLSSVGLKHITILI